MVPACDIKKKRKIQLVVTGQGGVGEGQLVALGGGVEVDTWNTKEVSLVLKVIFTFQGRIPLPYRMIFWKSAKGGESFSIQKIMLLILGTLNRAF